jgi:hypothetical protein
MKTMPYNTEIASGNMKKSFYILKKIILHYDMASQCNKITPLHTSIILHLYNRNTTPIKQKFLIIKKNKIMNGKLIYTEINNISARENLFKVEAKNLNTSTYILEIQGEDINYKKLVSKQ